LLLLVGCCDDDNHHHHSSAAQAVTITVALKTLLACLAYSMILGDSFQSLLLPFLDISRTQALLGVTVAGLLPLSLQKNLSNLAPFSALGLISFAVTVITVVTRWSDGSYNPNINNLMAGAETAVQLDGSASSAVAGTAASQFLIDLPTHLQPAFAVVDSAASTTATTLTTAAASFLPEPSGIVLLCTCATAYVAHFNVPRYVLLVCLCVLVGWLVGWLVGLHT